jgi:hypothetical protein
MPFAPFSLCFPLSVSLSPSWLALRAAYQTGHVVNPLLSPQSNSNIPHSLFCGHPLCLAIQLFSIHLNLFLQAITQRPTMHIPTYFGFFCTIALIAVESAHASHTPSTNSHARRSWTLKKRDLPVGGEYSNFWSAKYRAPIWRPCTMSDNL